MVKKSLLLSVVTLGLMVGMAAVPASADITQITLGDAGSGGDADFRFTGSGGTVTIDFLCSGVVCNSIGGVGFTSGTPFVVGNYTLTKNGAINLAGDGSITQDNPIAFLFDDGGGNTLTGDLQLVSFGQVGSIGNFNINLVANLTNIGGTLAGAFGTPQGIVDITIRLTLGDSVFGLFEQDGTIDAALSTGEIVPTPEPGSMLLIGSGLVAAGGFLRRRRAS